MSALFSLEALQVQNYPTPYFLFDGSIVTANLDMYRQALPEGTEICYAMKANSEPQVIEILNKQGASFEVASNYELAILKKLKVPPSRIIYGTSVKSETSIKDFYDYGVRRYAFDSEAELLKIARMAPGSKVYVRVLVYDRAHSVFTMSEKFGTRTNAAVRLLIQARSLGLKPYGISFNVGSQARNANAWANSLHALMAPIVELFDKGIRLEMIDLGGGFPFSYLPNDGIPSLQAIGAAITTAANLVPYPLKFLAEPGRGIVADAYVLVASIFARAKRPTGEWLYADAGAYNGLLETMAYQGSIRYRVELLRPSAATLVPFVLTGPTGDSLDVIDRSVLLPADIAVGDKLVVRDVGAYSFVLSTPFNGFPLPKIYDH